MRCKWRPPSAPVLPPQATQGWWEWARLPPTSYAMRGPWPGWWGCHGWGPTHPRRSASLQSSWGRNPHNPKCVITFPETVGLWWEKSGGELAQPLWKSLTGCPLKLRGSVPPAHRGAGESTDQQPPLDPTARAVGGTAGSDTCGAQGCPRSSISAHPKSRKQPEIY